MTPADVAYQQVLAAWISAGAAAVQAIGAIAAIIISIQLARSSARREQEAEAAASRRMEAADQAAEARIQQAKNEAHNNTVQRITSLGVLAVEACEEQIAQATSAYAANTGMVSGSLHNRRLAQLRDRLPELKKEAVDVELLEAISDLEDLVAFEPVRGEGGAAYVAALRADLDRLYNALHQVDSLRRV